MKRNITVQGTEIVLFEQNENDYISLTDIARHKSDATDIIIQNWIRNHNTIDYLGIWESINNLDFKPFIFEGFKNQTGENTFVMTPKKWITGTNAIGIISKPGRYGGTFAHKDIAFKFASWISPEFELYVIKEFQRLKQEEQHKKSLGWNVKRELASINYRIHTDAIQEHIIPNIKDFEKKYTYADEADMLNLIVFGKTSKEWREEHPHLAKTANMRDSAQAYELVVLSNLESFNAEFIRQGFGRSERYERLSEIARMQIVSLKKILAKNTYPFLGAGEE